MNRKSNNFVNLWNTWENPKKNMANITKIENNFLFLLIRSLDNDDFRYFFEKVGKKNLDP